MATNFTPDEVQRFIEVFNDLTSAVTGSTNAFSRNDPTVTNAYGVFKKASDDFSRKMTQNGFVYDKLAKNWVTSQEKEMKLLSESQKAKYDELQATRQKILEDVKRENLYKRELDSLGYKQNAEGKLVKTTIELTDQQKKQLNELREQIKTQENLKKAWENFYKEDLKKIAGSFGNLAKNAALGDTSFKSLNGILDTLGNTISGLVSAIPYVGSFLSATVKAATEASKVALELLDRNLKGFQELSNSGGLVADGMSGLSRQFLASGMTFDGYIKTVKNNAAVLAAFGGTVGLGAEKFSEAVGMLTKDSTNELRKLGLTADNIGEAAAQYLNMEMKLGRARQMDATALQKGTREYVKELDLLSKVTGLSREDAQKQRDELLADSRYRAARASMTDTGAKAMDAFIMTLKDPELKRGFMDLASGFVSTEAAGKVITQFGPRAQEMVDQLKGASQADLPKVFDDVQKSLQEGARQWVKQFGEVAKVLDPSVLGNAATFFDLQNRSLPSLKEALELQKKQIQSTDKLTENTVEAQKSMEKFSQNMFDIANKMLPFASKAVEKFATALKEITGWINEKVGGVTPVSTGGAEAGDAMGMSFPAAAAEGTPTPAAGSTLPLADRVKKLNFGGQREERTGGGDVTPELVTVAEKIAEMFPDATFTALNDKYHQKDSKRKGSKHRIGKALDVVLGKNAPQNADQSLAIKAQLRELMGVSDVRDEYFTQNDGGGKHFHVEVAKNGGIFSGPNSGYPVLLHGKETVLNEMQTSSLAKILSEVTKKEIPSISTATSATEIPIREILDMQTNLMNTLTGKLDDLSDKLSRSNDIQQNILNYSM